ncbi:MAG TPA: thiamine pyrophosphate-binding protein [Zeimonas sp.]|nr:thiamine pyrophosphate-binding protein [Zeimonas sp.]
MRPAADVAAGAAEVARRRLLDRMQRRDSVAGHDVVARSLARCGVTHVYGVPGRPIDATLAACLRAGIRVIGARQQQGAALMSIAHNYVAGGLRSAVIVSAGPAVANAATGVLVAHDNRWPLLVIGGRRGTDTGGAGAFQGFDGAGFLAPITKSATMAADTEGLADRLVEACVATMNGAPGPVYVDVAEEALSGRTQRLPASMVSCAPIAPGAPAGDADRVAIREAAHALAASRRPVLLIGKGLRWSGDWGWLRRLVEQHVVPFAAAPMARGFLPDDHPMCVSDVRGQALAEADLVMMVGARFNWTFHYGIEIAPTARIIRVDVDPDEARDVLGRGIGLRGDAAATARRLLDALDAPTATTRRAPRDVDWLARLQAMRRAVDDAIRAQADVRAEPMSPYQWLGEVREVLPASAITVLDGNVVMAAAQRMLPVRAPLGRVTAASNGCMGTGIPFAIGAKLACPERPVVAVCGDFGFGLSAIELETAVRHKVPITAIVANNGGPGGSTRQSEFFAAVSDEPVARYTDGIRHDLIARALGAQGVRVQGPGELGPALRSALAAASTTCIDVVTNDDVPLSPVI